MGRSLPDAPLRALLCAGLCAALLTPAAAQADVDGWTFEPPWFTVGDINGQDGWMKTNSAFDSEVASNPAPLQPLLGKQSLRISNAVTSGSFGDQTFSDSLVDAAGESTSDDGGLAGGVRQKTFVYSFDFTSAAPGNQQAGLRVPVAADRGDGGRQTSIVLTDSTPAGMDVTFIDTPVPVPAGGTVNFVDHVVGTGLTRGDVHSVRVEIDFNEGPDNDVARVFVDDILQYTGESWENYYRYDAEQAGSGNKVPTTDALIFRTNQTAAPATAGKGFRIDNVRVESFGGANGPVGPQGPQGAAGTNGTNGTAGTNGVNGVNGVNGAQGLPGPTTPAAVGQDNPVTIASGALRASSAGVVRVPITCPAGAGLCEGVVSLTSGRTGLGSKRFVLRGGRSARVSVRLTRSALTRIRARRIRSARISVFSRDLEGDATEAVRTVRVSG
jgi:hypothetical protein